VGCRSCDDFTSIPNSPASGIRPAQQSSPSKEDYDVKLTPEQYRALAWINEFPCNESEWRTGNKPASGPPSKWDRIRLTGSAGSIVIMTDDWRAIHPFIDIAEIGTPNKIWAVTPAGLAALAEHRT
jgi:hypothetical protein